MSIGDVGILTGSLVVRGSAGRIGDLLDSRAADCGGVERGLIVEMPMACFSVRSGDGEEDLWPFWKRKERGTCIILFVDRVVEKNSEFHKNTAYAALRRAPVGLYSAALAVAEGYTGPQGVCRWRAK